MKKKSKNWGKKLHQNRGQKLQLEEISSERPQSICLSSVKSALLNSGFQIMSI